MPTTGSLYFHIPFCTKKCHYCHFYVIPDKDIFKIKLLDGFDLELNFWAKSLATLRIKSIYFGGGTPSLIGPRAIERVLSHIKQIAFIEPLAEITLEANPENITAELMHAYSEVGINRLSIGIQTLDDSLLACLGRGHSADKAIDGVYSAIKGNISNLSVDLMYDLPGQTLLTWENTLNRIIQLPIKHLSLYNLTIEPYTSFYKHKETISKQQPDEVASLRMYEMAVDILEEQGLKQYEISAFSEKGYHSSHNVGYWTGRPFLGFGPSAFSYWEGKRFKNVSNLNRYYQSLKEGNSPVDFSEQLAPIEARRELLAIHLRLTEGVDIPSFQALHGELDSDTVSTLASLSDKGLLMNEGSQLCLTPQGRLFYDLVASEIV